MKVRSIARLAVGIAVLAGLPATVFAQDVWPSKPVRILVPFAVGGSTDNITRMAIDWLQQEIPGSTFVAENKAGAGGTIAATDTARAAPDGYTLMMLASAQGAIVPAVQTVTYDPVKNFQPIKLIATNPFVLVANSGLPAKTTQELLVHAKAQAGKFSYASAGQGSVAHLSSALFFKKAGVEVGHVAYRGNAPALVDVIAGHVGMMFSTLPEALAHEKNDKVRLLAVTSNKRSPYIPNVPTVEEAGIKGYDLYTWNGLVGPMGLPKTIIDKIHAALVKRMKDKDALEKFKALGLDADFGSPDDFAATIKKDLPMWAEIVNLAGAKVQ